MEFKQWLDELNEPTGTSDWSAIAARLAQQGFSSPQIAKHVAEFKRKEDKVLARQRRLKGESVVPALVQNAVNNVHGKVLQRLGPAMIKIRPETNQLAFQMLQGLGLRVQEVPGQGNLNNIVINGKFVADFHGNTPIVRAA